MAFAIALATGVNGRGWPDADEGWPALELNCQKGD